MITATIVTTDEELQQIIELQRKNLKQHISEEEKNAQGFLTMEFKISMLKQLHQLAPSVIIIDDDKVVAFAIVVMQEGRKFYHDLEPLFEIFSKLEWQHQPLASYSYYVMGQICIDKDYRGKGLFDILYQKHREIYKDEFDFIITEISTSNYRSLKAHQRVGFETIYTFRDKLDEWNIVIWNWN